MKSATEIMGNGNDIKTFSMLTIHDAKCEKQAKIWKMRKRMHFNCKSGMFHFFFSRFSSSLSFAVCFSCLFLLILLLLSVFFSLFFSSRLIQFQCCRCPCKFFFCFVNIVLFLFHSQTHARTHTHSRPKILIRLFVLLCLRLSGI